MREKVFLQNLLNTHFIFFLLKSNIIKPSDSAIFYSWFFKQLKLGKSQYVQKLSHASVLRKRTPFACFNDSSFSKLKLVRP